MRGTERSRPARRQRVTSVTFSLSCFRVFNGFSPLRELLRSEAFRRFTTSPAGARCQPAGGRKKRETQKTKARQEPADSPCHGTESRCRRSLVSHWRTAGASPSAVMLRNLFVLLTCTNALATKPSSIPALQPVSMHKRMQILLRYPSRSALIDVLHGPYPAKARPAYQRVAHGLLVVVICWLHMKQLLASLPPLFYVFPFLKAEMARCKQFCGEYPACAYDCEFRVGMIGGYIDCLVVGAIGGLVYVPLLIWIFS